MPPFTKHVVLRSLLNASRKTAWGTGENNLLKIYSWRLPALYFHPVQIDGLEIFARTGRKKIADKYLIECS